MRDFLQDALDHQDAGMGRAQGRDKPTLPKRFYTTAAHAAVAGGYAITLDGRSTKTPGQVPVVVPSAPVADRLVSEWAAQREVIDPRTMPHVRLVNSAIEGGDAAHGPLLDEVIKYGGSDLLLYRAESPVELVALQDEKWDAVLVALARQYGVSFTPTVGVMHKTQPEETLARLREAIADADLFTAAALVSITGLTGSGLLAIAIREGLIAREAAWTVAHLDEDYQASLWGEDFEAMQRRSQRRAEYDAAVNLVEWMAD